MPKRIKKKNESSLILANPLAEKKSKLAKPEVPPQITIKDEDPNPDPIKEPNFNVFVGTEIGILKGIAIGEELPITKSLYKPEGLKVKPPAVVSLAWTDESEKDILVCFANQVVKTYNSKLKCFTRQIVLDVEDETDKVVGLSCMDESHYVYGLESGTVSIYNNLEASTTASFKVCKATKDPKMMPDLRKIRQCRSDPTVFATGGKENDLKIWNLAGETSETPTFSAKNLPHDWLELRHPIWVQDLTFLPRTSEVVAVATRFGQVRLYDVRAGQRPVSNIQFCDHPVMSITSTMNDRQVVVGTARGEAGLYDLRNPGAEKLCLKFRGFSGSIRTMVGCPELPYVVSSGLDRFLYIHKLTQREPLKKLYLSQQINDVIVSKSFMKDWDKNHNAQGDWVNIPPEVLDVMPPPAKKLDSPRVKKVPASGS